MNDFNTLLNWLTRYYAQMGAGGTNPYGQPQAMMPGFPRPQGGFQGRDWAPIPAPGPHQNLGPGVSRLPGGGEMYNAFDDPNSPVYRGRDPFPWPAPAPQPQGGFQGRDWAPIPAPYPGTRPGFIPDNWMPSHPGVTDPWAREREADSWRRASGLEHHDNGLRNMDNGLRNMQTILEIPLQNQHNGRQPSWTGNPNVRNFDNQHYIRQPNGDWWQTGGPHPLK